MINKNELKELLIQTFTTKRIENVWKYPHIWRMQWLVIIPGCLGIAYHNNILSISVIIFAIITIACNFSSNYFVSKNNNPIKSEKIFLYMDSMLFGAWSGLLGFHLIVMLIALSLSLCPILYYGLKRIYINFCIYFFSAIVAYYYGDASHGAILAYDSNGSFWDGWLFFIAIFQYLSISLLIYYTMNSTKSLERTEESNMHIRDYINSLEGDCAEKSLENKLLKKISAFAKEKFDIKSMVYFTRKSDGVLEFNKTYSTYYDSDEAFFEKILLSTVEENSIFNYAFRKNSLYFHIKNEKSSGTLLNIFEQLNAKTIIVYPVFCQRVLKGVFLLVSHEKDYLNRNFKCLVTEYLLSKFVLLQNTKNVFDDIEEIQKSLLVINEKKGGTSKQAEKYLDKEVLEKYIFNHLPNSLHHTSERKRVLTLCLDLRLLTKKSFNDMEILNEFYHYIFPEFVKIANNYSAKIECISAERLVAYWEEGEDSFKHLTKNSTYMAMELRELLNVYFSMRLQRTLLHISQVRTLLYLSYVTFTVFGNGDYNAYTYYSHEGETFYRRASQYPGNTIVCNEPVQLLLKSDVASTVINDGINQDKFYLLMLSQDEKKHGDEYCKNINEKITERQKVSLAKKIQTIFNPTHQSFSEWFKCLLIDLFTTKNIDTNVKYAQILRWFSIPVFMGIYGLLYSMNAVTPFLIVLLSLFIFLKFIENFLVIRVENTLQQERINALLDCAMLGFCVGVTTMPLSLVYFTCFVVAYSILWFGPRFFLKTSVTYLVSIVVGLLYQGYHFGVVHPLFYDIYFLSLLLFLGISISIVMRVYQNIIESVNKRASIQKNNITKAIELIHYDGYMRSENSLNKTLSAYFHQSLDMKAVLYYQIKEDNKFWLNNIFCHYISEEEKKIMVSKPLSALGDDNIFINTYKKGELYFQLFEKDIASKNLLDVKNILKAKQLIIYVLSTEKKYHGLILFAADSDDIINDNLKLVPLTLATTSFNGANDSIRLHSDYTLSKERVLKIKNIKEILSSSVKSVLQEEVISFIFDPAKAKEKVVPRKRLVSLYINLSAFTMGQENVSDSLKEFYQQVFDNYYKLVKKCRGQVDKVCCDGLVAYWDEEDEFTFKELTKAAILFANEFRQVLSSLEEQYKNMKISYKILIATNYVTFESFGNEEYKEYTFINPTLGLLLKYVSEMPKGIVLCDEATYLIAKDSVHLAAIPEMNEKQRLYYIVANEQDKELFKDVLAAKKGKG